MPLGIPSTETFIWFRLISVNHYMHDSMGQLQPWSRDPGNAIYHAIIHDAWKPDRASDRTMPTLAKASAAEQLTTVWESENAKRCWKPLPGFNNMLTGENSSKKVDLGSHHTAGLRYQVDRTANKMVEFHFIFLYEKSCLKQHIKNRNDTAWNPEAALLVAKSLNFRWP